MCAGKQDFVMTVCQCSLIGETLDCERSFGCFSGMLGNSMECYADAMFPKYS